MEVVNKFEINFFLKIVPFNLKSNEPKFLQPFYSNEMLKKKHVKGNLCGNFSF